MEQAQKRTWAEIHMDRLEENYRQLRALAPESGYIGIVKANAYGHGAVPVGKKLEQLGADYLAVACLDEAMELRRGGVEMPVLILGYTAAEYVPELLQYDLTQTIYDPEQARVFSRIAQEQGEKLKCHLKADTGMSRLGILCDEAHLERAAEELAEMARLPGLDAEGIFMHFADADSDPDYSAMQQRRFFALLDLLRARGVTFEKAHCCASAAVCNCPGAHLSLIRPGIALYGLYPDPSTEKCMTLRPVMELKSRIASVKRLPKGTSVSYGCTYTLQRDSVVAAVPVGYADGLPRRLSGRMEMLVRGTRAPQIGRICMDMCMLDVTDLPEVQVGDVVTVFGDGAPLQVLADRADTISYELMCAISPRVPRIYLP